MMAEIKWHSRYSRFGKHLTWHAVIDGWGACAWADVTATEWHDKPGKDVLCLTCRNEVVRVVMDEQHG